MRIAVAGVGAGGERDQVDRQQVRVLAGGKEEGDLVGIVGVGDKAADSG